MFLINISSNYNAKFNIGSVLTRLNELGDMYVSSMYRTPDRQGSEHDYANCCIQLHHDQPLDSLYQVVKSLENELGRGSTKGDSQYVVVDIDVLAQYVEADWQFIPKRLPLTDDACWALAELEVTLPNSPTQTSPVLADWQL